jgi:hypothetical protein
MPSTNENSDPSAKLRFANAPRSTIGSRAMSTRAKNATAERPEIQAQARTVVSPNQSLRGPSSSTYSSAPRKAAMKIRPDQSKFSNSLRFGLSKSISMKAMIVTTMPGPILMKNSQCHDSASVR